eukprot:Em0006g472a
MTPTTGDNSSMTMEMQMFFYFGQSMTLLFPSWNISTVQGLVGSIFAMLFLSIFYEGLKSFREYLMHVAVKSLGASSNSCSDAKPAPGKPNWRSIFLGKSKLPLLIHVIQSILQMIQIGVAYLLMLAVMTYNGWIFLAIVFGSGIGYLIFGWTKFLYGVRSTQDHNDCCN